MIRALFVESNEADARMALRLVAKAAPGEVELARVECLSTGLRRLTRESFDAILLDLDVIDTHGQDTFNQVQRAFARIPIVLLVRRDNEAVAFEALQHGAQDYLFKETYDGDALVNALRKAVQRKRAERGLTYLAQVDELTTLANRTLFRDRATQALARTRRKNHKLAVVRVGLDHFREVNSSYGQDVGDGVLKNAAFRLQSCLREVDTVGRQWGDEFIILLEGVASDSDISFVTQRILYALAEPYEVVNQQVKLTASIGIGLFPRDGHSLDDLLASAEAAMHQAKEQGGNLCCFYAAGEGAGA